MAHVIAIDGPAGAGKSTIARRLAERLGYGAWPSRAAPWRPRRAAAVAAVRAALVEKQRRLAERESVVMEGRDIGTVVFPNARVKIYLDADEGERVRRRSEQQPGVSAGQLSAELAERDARDRSRVESPLVQAPDAAYLNSTGLTPEEVEEAILRIVRARISNGKEH